MKVDRRTFVLSCGAATATSSFAASAETPLTPEQFGAKGDGLTNDTKAFAAMSAQLNRSGGGTISLGSGKTYVVGQQQPQGQFAFTPSPIIELHHLRRPLRLLGQGARLKCAAGLRYGAFSRATGRPLQTKLPNYNAEQLASPYRAMIFIHDCRVPVEIRDVRLDGNASQLRLGGPWGDVGRQVPATGLLLLDNSGEELVSNVRSYDHALDGMMVGGAVARTTRSRIANLVCRRNGRQGLSLIGGRRYDFVDCEFSQSGRGPLRSDPAAGVDIEAEGKTVRDLSFNRCKFVDNSGVGLLAESGDSADARFTDCQFVGTTTWSAWPRKPGFIFTGCTFAGAVVHPFPAKNPDTAARFNNCRFTDDAALSPTGKIYEGGPKGGPIVNMGASDNVLFDECTFALTNRAVLPWSWNAVYRNCRMSQTSTVTAMTKGRFLGTTTIHGPVDLYGSMVIGRLVVNGKVIPPGAKGIKPW